MVEPSLISSLGRAVEHRRREVQAQRVRRPAEVRLEDLADVHARGHAQRIEHDLDRRAVGQVRHVLLGEDPRDDALVAVAAGHLVADRELALRGDVDLDQLDHARRQLVAAADLLLLLLEQLADCLHLPLGALLEVAEVVLEARVVRGHLEPDHLLIRQILEDSGVSAVPFFSRRSRPYSSYEVGPERLALQHRLSRFFTSS